MANLFDQFDTPQSPPEAAQTPMSGAGATPTPDPVAPAQEAPAAPEAPSEDGGFLDTLGEIVIGGIRDAAQETFDLTHEAGQFLEENVLSLGTVGGGEVEEENPIQLPEVEEPQNPVAQVARDFVQLGVGMLGAGKILKPTQAVTRAGRAGRFFATGAAADFVVVDPLEARLSNFIDSTGYGNIITDALRADPDDTTWEGRLKNAVEGAGIGAATDVVFSVAKFARGYAKARGQGGKATAEYLEEALPELELSMKDQIQADEQLEMIFGEPLDRAAQRAFNPETIAARVETADTVERVLRTANDEVEELSKTVPFEEIQKRAAKAISDVMDVSPDQAMAFFQGTADDVRGLSTKMVATRAYINDLAGRQAPDLAKQYQANPTPETAEALGRAVGELRDISTAFKASVSEVARALGSQRIDVETIQMATRAIDDPATLAKDIIAAEGNLKAISRLSFWQRAGQHLARWRMNALLSNPATTLTNVLSGEAKLLAAPFERVVGAAFSGNVGEMRSAVDQMQGIMMGFRDSMRMARIALKENGNILDPLQKQSELDTAFGNTSTGKAWAQFFQLPSRFLMAGDELVKQQTYRSIVIARGLQEARAQGLSGRAASQHASDYLDRSIRDGMGLDESGMWMARETTFTDQFHTQWARNLESSLNAVPFFRVFVPFVRTPSMIIKDAWFRTPGLQALSGEFRARWDHADPAIRSMTRGRAAIGLGTMAWATDAALSGNITGAGPTDPAQRALLFEDGWRPHSIRFGDQWVSYRKIEPLATLLGGVADFVDIVTHVEDKDVEEITNALALAFTRNVTSKTYVQGIMDVAEVMSDPDRYLESYAGDFASTLLPFSSGLQPVAQAIGEGDPVMREVNGIMDRIKKKVPGFSQTLPARINFYTGQPIEYPESAVLPSKMNPLPIIKEERDPVFEVLYQIGMNMRPPSRQLRGVELSPQQYQQLNVLHGTNRIGGKTLYQRLDTELGRARAAGRSDDFMLRIAEAWVQRHRDLARNQLVMSDTGLKTQIIQKQEERKLSILQQGATP